jgi:hypothetical protein
MYVSKVDSLSTGDSEVAPRLVDVVSYGRGLPSTGRIPVT